MTKLLGPIDISLDIQEDYHRNFKVKWLVEHDNASDGPIRAMQCPGLPNIGALYSFNREADLSAYCWPNWTVSQYQSSNGEPNTLWVVEQPYSTRFNLPAISSSSVDNPFAQPAGLSGSFVKYQREMTLDKDDKPMYTMSFEPFRGKASEFDDNRPTVSVEMNYPTLGLNVFAFMIDHVNDASMWGLSKRMVKLSNIRWTRNVYKFGYFYTRSYDFDVDFKTFDRIVPQMGTKKLITGGTKTDPTHWEVRRDSNKQVTREPFYYTSTGVDWDGVTESDIVQKTLKYYKESNFFTLGIPSSF